MLVRIKSLIDKDAWYSEMLGRTMNVIDLNNPLYLFADINGTLPIFKMDVDIIEDGKKNYQKN